MPPDRTYASSTRRTTRGSRRGQSPVTRSIASAGYANSVEWKRSSTSSTLPRTHAMPTERARSARASSSGFTVVAKTTRSIPGTAVVRASTCASIGRPTISSSAFPGNRVDPRRAWTMATTLVMVKAVRVVAREPSAWPPPRDGSSAAPHCHRPTATRRPRDSG